MDSDGLPDVRAAEVVLPCAELDATLAFFTERLGFRVDAVFPADEPREAVVSGHGLRIRLSRTADGAPNGGPGVVRLHCAGPLPDGATELTAPNGTLVQLVAARAPLVLPPVRPSFVLSRMADDAAWGMGRAGMLYRDLVPDRQGGRFIASHIRIPDGGPVPDYVHFHRVLFQLIYCYAGWVRVVYEDQGPAFVMRPGDCVLQPPEIRHRVLECSPGLEVVEISCPADHETHADHVLALPTAASHPERLFGGQRFLRHEASSAEWQPARAGFEARDTGMAAASGGAASATVLRRAREPASIAGRHDADLLFGFVLRGAATLRTDSNADEPLSPGDAYVVPRGLSWSLTGVSEDLELLEVTAPAQPG